MTQEITSKIKKLESLLDLEGLREGDLVELRYKFSPYGTLCFQDYFAMFIINLKNPESKRFSFLAPIEKDKELKIILYKIRARDAIFENGKIVLLQRVSKKLEVSPNMRVYQPFLELLRKY